MRTLPIGNTKEKILAKMREGDRDGVWNVWANAMQWNHFLGKTPRISCWPKFHEVTLYSVGITLRDRHVSFYVKLNWLNGTVESQILPLCPDGHVMTRAFMFDREGEELPFEAADAREFNIWEVPGQRYMENFVDMDVTRGTF